MLGLKVECRACASQVKFFSDKSETRSIPPYANLLRTYLVEPCMFERTISHPLVGIITTMLSPKREIFPGRPNVDIFSELFLIGPVPGTAMGFGLWPGSELTQLYPSTRPFYPERAWA